MIDVTDDIKMERNQTGKRIEYSLTHLGARIGHVEPGGFVLESRAYKLRFVPNRQMHLETRVFALEDDELESI
jgi:hypothetical protein